MCGWGSTTVTEASPARSLDCNPRAVYMPTYPPPTIRIFVGCDLTAAIPISSHWLTPRCRHLPLDVTPIAGDVRHPTTRPHLRRNSLSRFGRPAFGIVSD